MEHTTNPIRAGFFPLEPTEVFYSESGLFGRSQGKSSRSCRKAPGPYSGIPEPESDPSLFIGAANDERYKLSFDFAPVGYATVEVVSIGSAPLAAGTVARICEVNAAAAHFFGRPPNELGGASLSSLLPPPQWARLAKAVSNAYIGSGAASCEVNLPQANGTTLYLQVTATTAGETQHLMLLMLRDVTIRRQEELQLQGIEDDLRAANKNKDDFLIGLSCELRNSIAPILANLDLADRRTAFGVPTRGTLNTIGSQVAELAQIVDHISILSDASLRRLALNSRRVDLGKIAKASLDANTAQKRGHNIKITGKISNTPCWIHADAERVAQAMDAILGSVEDFVQPGGCIDVHLKDSQSVGRIEFTDVGSSIDATTLQSYFDPFYRATRASTKQRTKGHCGLRLAMAKQLIEQQGGHVEVSSRGVGMGTCLTLSLPIDVTDTATAESAQAPSQRLHRVLIIEDNVDTADSLGAALQCSGHDVQVAYDGMAGLAAAQSFKPDVVVCDICLPRMDGYAVARILRQTSSALPLRLIALSGRVHASDAQLTQEAGFNIYLAKPCSVATLERAFNG